MGSYPELPEKRAVYANGHASQTTKSSIEAPQLLSARSLPQSQAGVIQLLVCVGGIYASFLTWGLLQERITTTPYAPEPNSLQPKTAQEYFRFPIVLNTLQSLFAFLSGTLYILFTTGSLSVPCRNALLPLTLVSVTQTLASPFGYASLSHVDYLTFVLAKSCKLLPVMALHITLFGKRYPFSKYLIVLTVTAGVALFTLYHPPKPGKTRSSKQSSSIYGLSLLGVNLLFDGLTNTVQDHIFKSPTRYGRLTGPQMMSTTNLLSTVLMSIYLVLTPRIPHSLLPTMVSAASTNELSAAISFLRRHPSVLTDVVAFAFCGAIGQLFIFATLEKFSSLLLVTVTVTRKMLTMILSVVWYGKSLTQGQWMGVALVFSGIGAEGLIARSEKKAKEKNKSQ